jgi:hypothetical protein
MAVWGIVAVVVSVLSAGYSIIQAKKQRDAAKKAADARKGFEIPVEAQAINLPICYGRVKIGGARTFHNTKGSFSYTTPNSDKVFLAGIQASDVKETAWWLPDADGNYEIPVDYMNLVMEWGSFVYNSYGYGNSLTTNISGNTNSFIFFQQALCQAPIHATYDVIVDESRYLNDPTLGTDLYLRGGGYIEGALRIDVHHAGSKADSIMAANYGERRSAVYQDIAYVSVVARIDRDNPQFSGVPVLQFLIEGKKIKTIQRSGTLNNYTYTLSSSTVYSNNPAYVLLDYLLDSVSGKSVPLASLDLESFYNSAQICDRIIQTNVKVAGKIWNPTLGGRVPVFSRDLPLYECNIVIDTDKTIRENVEAILATMGDARLVWSQGKYKLNLYYFENNSEIVPAEVLTDDNILLEQNIEINYPDLTNKWNHATVRFSNEAENFKEDSASWPPKLEPSVAIPYRKVLVALGGATYGFGAAASGWDDKYDSGPLLNNYSVWNGNGSTSTVTYLLIIPKEWVQQGGTTFQFEAAGDDYGTYTINDYNYNDMTIGAVKLAGTIDNWKGKYGGSVTLGDSTEDKVYRISITVTDNSGQTSEDKGSKAFGRGIAARLIQGNFVVWTTREPAYTVVEERIYNNLIYRQFLEEDNGMTLETNIFAEGITDYYHALAKAEELVRTSRGSFSVKLNYKITDRFLEPGDIVQINSNTLGLGTNILLYFKVNGIKINSDFTAELEMSRFDASFLAWNTKDDEIVRPEYNYETRIPAPLFIRYLPADLENEEQFQSSGKLEWADVSFPDFESFVLYAHNKLDGFDANGAPIFREIGRTKDTLFMLPSLAQYSTFFAVRVISKSGKLSQPTYTNIFWNETEDRFDIIGVELSRPWLDPLGNIIFKPNGLIGPGAFLNINGSVVELSEVAFNSLVPSLNYVGEFSTPPTELQLEANWKQNSVYKNTTDGKSYVLTGTPLDWVIYLEGGTSFDIVVSSSAGTIFRPGQASETTLAARLFKNGAEVTDVTPATWFRWRRLSSIPKQAPYDDITWNNQHVNGFKTILVDVDDVDSRATFFCDIISPQ